MKSVFGSALFRSFAGKVGTSGINEKAVFHRASAEEHSELYVVSIGEAELDFPRVLSQCHGDLNEGANLFVPS